MGLTKQYLRYAASGLFNVIGSSKANVVFVKFKGVQGKLCAVGACEHVLIWDLRKGEKLATLEGENHEVTILAASSDKLHLAVGYADGAIRVFNILTGEVAVTFSGHKSAVTALNYDCDGVRLVSGSKDTDVIVWDIVNESGLFRLKGHKGVVTQTRFLTTRNILVTSSKDTYVKFWDLDTQHCFKTVVGHKTEVWDFVVVNGERRLITGSADNELRVWILDHSPQSQDSKQGHPEKRRKLDLSEDDRSSEEEESEDEEEEDGDSVLMTCTRLGSLPRHGKDRVVSMSADHSGRIFACHGNDRMLEVFRVNTEQEVKKHIQKRQKKAKRKAREAGLDDTEVTVETNFEDEFKRLPAVTSSSKVKAFDCLLEQSGKAKIVCLLVNNSLETNELDVSEKNAEVKSLKLKLPGHRSDVRTVCFSSDNTAILSASADQMKIWNRATLHCIRTAQCDYALCSLFAPGDRHVLVGTKSGKIQIFDIGAGLLLESIEAHAGAVWSLSLAPNKRSIVSGSADKDLKFWDFELISDETFASVTSTSKRLTLVHTRTLKMSEDILCVKHSADQKFIAASLLDNTVKVFFADTLKFFLSMYGHKLPVLCMDISSRSDLLVTGSADRNVKIWGMDFGDCHKSIFAHDDSIMCIQFIPNTHMFFTGGKDGLLKQWDADTFEHILTLKGHRAEIWCLAVSPSANFVVTGSHDRSLRLWEKTDEPLVLDEEKEMEREKEYEGTVAEGGEPVIAGETNKETGVAGRKTIETVKAAERIMEALELHKEETAKREEVEDDELRTGKKQPPVPLHPLFQAYKVTTPTRYVLEILKRVKSSELEESLLVLPFSYVGRLLELLNDFVEHQWEVELSCRCLFFLLKIHQGQITSNQMLLPIMSKLRTNTTNAVTHIRDTIGFNLAGLRFLKQQLEQKDEVIFFSDATDRFKQKKKRQKKRAILSIKT